MEIHTIGFTKRSAESFFEALAKAQIGRVIDVRLHNTSQLSGFAKRGDLEYFLGHLTSASYAHEPLLAPTEELLSAYRKKKISWAEYQDEYLRLLESRDVSNRIDKSLFVDRLCLLCSEFEATRCHRRLAAEYLKAAWGDASIIHL